MVVHVYDMDAIPNVDAEQRSSSVALLVDNTS